MTGCRLRVINQLDNTRFLTASAERSFGGSTGVGSTMGNMALVCLSDFIDPNAGWLVDGLCKVETLIWSKRFGRDVRSGAGRYANQTAGTLAADAASYAAKSRAIRKVAPPRRPSDKRQPRQPKPTASKVTGKLVGRTGGPMGAPVIMIRPGVYAPTTAKMRQRWAEDQGLANLLERKATIDD